MLTERNTWQERVDLGREMTCQLGRDRPIVFVGNVPHALPPAARESLAQHTVPPSAYEGRTPWIAASYSLSEPPIVVMQESPYEKEIEVLLVACQKLDILPPIIQIYPNGFPYDHDTIQKLVEPNGHHFHHPFIGTADYSNSSNGSALPDSQPFQNKARMREHLSATNTVPGIPILAGGKSVQEHCTDIRKAVMQLGGDVRVKVATTASGMNTVRTNSQRFRDDTVHRRQTLEELIPDYIHKPEGRANNDIIVENEITFGHQNEYADYGFRGYLLPDGKFKFTSVGRVISTEEGVYQGMFMATPENSHLIGLSEPGLKEGCNIMATFAHSIHQEGYSGPINLDIFENGNSDHPGLVHDFNMRDGGSSASGAFAKVVNPNGIVLDIDLRLSSGRLKDKEINEMIALLWERHQVITYSTTFLRYPVTQPDGNKMYTVKVMVPIEDSVAIDEQGREIIRNKVKQFNEWGVANGTFHFDE